MKQKDRLYAKAFVDVISKKTSAKMGNELINNFLKLLEKKGALKNAKKIVDLAEFYYIQQQGNKKIILESARKVNTKNLLKGLVTEGDIIQEKIKPTLIAGVKVIINNEKQLDFSLKNKLDKIFKTSA